MIKRLPFNIIKRSILKYEDNEYKKRAIKNSFTALKGDFEGFATDNIELSNLPTHIEAIRIYRVANKLFAAGYNVNEIILNFVLPFKFKESYLKDIIINIKNLIKEMGAKLIIGDVSYLDNLKSGIITAFAKGERFKDIKYVEQSEKMSMIMVGYVAKDFTSDIIYRKKDILKQFLPDSLLDIALIKCNDLSIRKALTLAYKEGIFKAHYLGHGGVFAGIYELSEHLNMGFNVDLSRISILQETIEICEILQENPYTACSYGAALLLSNSERIKDILKNASIKAEAIGIMDSETNDKIIMHNGNIRYLDRP